MRKTLTDRGVAALKPRPKRYAVPDPEMRGLWIRVQPSGGKSFWTIGSNPEGKQVWTHIGAADIGIATARELARPILQRVRMGLPAVEAKAETLAAVAANWLKRHVEGNGLRSRDEIERVLNAYILPTWRDRTFASIRRNDVAALLDEVEDNHGARQADYVLAIVRAVMNWYGTRHEDYASPIVRGMRRINPKERARSRTLTDDEIRAVWKVAEDNGTFGALIRLLLLTAQRHAKVVAMRWQDITSDATWTIPTAPREKGNAVELVLPQLALDIIRAQPRFDANPFVLAGRGNGHLNNPSNGKRAFDQKLAAELPGMERWTLHDLRRTARSLMSRAGVSSEYAERVMGHAIGGVEGIYDRHRYAAEKADALRKLAALINAIVNEHGADVLPMKVRR
jgi:integrase